MRERWRVYNQIMYNAKVKVPWLIGTKHFPESKTLPRIQNNSQNPKHFWILGSVLAKCFWILGRVLDSGKYFLLTSHRIKEP